MKRKILVVIAAAAIIITTFKTGYAYYESQIKASAEQNFDTPAAYSDNNVAEVTKEIEEDIPVVLNNEINDLTQSDDSDASVYESTSEEEFFGGCCGSDAYSMLDENGNFKSPEVYEKELDEGIQNGELTQEDKDYFMEIYNECYEFYFNNSQELSGEEF